VLRFFANRGTPINVPNINSKTQNSKKIYLVSMLLTRRLRIKILEQSNCINLTEIHSKKNSFRLDSKLHHYQNAVLPVSWLLVSSACSLLFFLIFYITIYPWYSLMIWRQKPMEDKHGEAVLLLF
jgi:hypothetical protein